MRPPENERSGITADLVRDLLTEVNPATGRPHTGADIARAYGVTAARVSQLRRQSGALTPRQRAMQLWPWRVPDGSTAARSSLRKRLGDHLAYVGGASLSDGQRQRLRQLYTRLRDRGEVVAYTPGGGFACVPRTAGDRDLIVRIDEHTVVATDSLDWWRFPEVRP